MRKRGRRRDHRTSKIGGRWKRRAEKREGRKEGRKDAGVSAFWQTNASIPGGSSTESVSVSLFLFRSSPTFPLRASQPLFLFLFLPRVPSPHHSPRAATRALRCTLLTENRGPPPSPSPSSSLPGLSSPVPPQAALLTTRSPPPDKDKLRCIFRAPKSSNVLYHPRPSPLRATSALDPRLPPSTELTSYVAQPSSCHFPRSCPDHPRPPSPSPPAASETLCYVGHQMGAQPPTHSGRASCPRTTSRLLQLCQPPRILLLPPLAPAAAAS